MLSENSIYCDKAEIEMMIDKIRKTFYTFVDYTSTVFAVVEQLVLLITRAGLVAMAKVTADILGNLVLLAIESNITLGQ